VTIDYDGGGRTVRLQAGGGGRHQWLSSLMN